MYASIGCMRRDACLCAPKRNEWIDSNTSINSSVSTAASADVESWSVSDYRDTTSRADLTLSPIKCRHYPPSRLRTRKKWLWCWLDCWAVHRCCRYYSQALRSCSAGIACRVAWRRAGMSVTGRGRYLTFAMGDGSWVLGSRSVSTSPSTQEKGKKTNPQLVVGFVCHCVGAESVCVRSLMCLSVGVWTNFDDRQDFILIRLWVVSDGDGIFNLIYIHKFTVPDQGPRTLVPDTSGTLYVFTPSYLDLNQG